MATSCFVDTTVESRDSRAIVSNKLRGTGAFGATRPHRIRLGRLLQRGRPGKGCHGPKKRRSNPDPGGALAFPLSLGWEGGR
jgi:hypothetical protein